MSDTRKISNASDHQDMMDILLRILNHTTGSAGVIVTADASKIKTVAALDGSINGVTFTQKADTDNIPEADMLAGVRAAYEAGWRRVKVYFMAGLPGETAEDIDEIYYLCRRLSDARREVDGRQSTTHGLFGKR